MTQAYTVPVADPVEARAPWWRRPVVVLAAIAVVHALSPLLFMGPHWWFGSDESMYLSQLNAHVPPGGFSAPRARGTTFVAAPVTLLTSSTVAVRLWVTALSGLALFLSFRVWLRLRPGFVVPLAAALFASLWPVIYYGFEVMPNEWVAFAAVAACGYAVVYLDGGRRSAGLVVIGAMAAIGLFRPSDAGYAGIPLIAAVLLIPGADLDRRIRTALAVLIGIVGGVAEWVVEAYTSFGGLSARIHAAQAEQGGGGIHFAGAAQARALAGPLLCRDGCQVHAALVYRIWWVAALVGIAAALWPALRSGGPVRSALARPRPDGSAAEMARVDVVRLEVVPLVVGLGLAVEYVFTVTYAAPRFLIPTYALLALPCASGLLHLARRPRPGRPRTVLAAVIAVGLLIHLGLQARIIVAHVRPALAPYNRDLVPAARRLRELGLRAPCLVIGLTGPSQNLAYAAGCTNTPRRPVLVRPELARGVRVLLLNTARPTRTYGGRWIPVELPVTVVPAGSHVYLSAP